MLAGDISGHAKKIYDLLLRPLTWKPLRNIARSGAAPHRHGSAQSTTTCEALLQVVSYRLEGDLVAYNLQVGTTDQTIEGTAAKSSTTNPTTWFRRLGAISTR